MTSGEYLELELKRFLGLEHLLHLLLAGCGQQRTPGVERQLGEWRRDRWQVEAAFRAFLFLCLA